MSTSRRTVLQALGASTLGLAALPLSGCASGPARAESDTGEDELTFLISNLDGGWVPSKSAISSYEANVWQQLTDKLVHTDAEGTLSPWIATRWEQNAEATEYVLHLREGVTFSDGTPLDAAAVLANLEAWAVGRPEKGIARVGLFPGGTYEGAEALDDLTVRVTFTKTSSTAVCSTSLPCLSTILCLISPIIRTCTCTFIPGRAPGADFIKRKGTSSKAWRSKLLGSTKNTCLCSTPLTRT